MFFVGVNFGSNLKNHADRLASSSNQMLKINDKYNSIKGSGDQNRVVNVVIKPITDYLL